MLELNFTPFPTLQTERLLLRQLETTDDQALHAMRTDERVNAFIDRPRPAAVADTQAFLQKILAAMAANESIHWVISLKNDGRLIGSICYWNVSPENDCAEIGYELHPDFQGQGIMQEVLPAVFKFGFEVMKLQKIRAVSAASNARSVRLLEKLHFEIDRSATELVSENGLKFVVYVLDETTWKA